MARIDKLRAAIAKNEEYLENRDAINYHKKIEAFKAEIALIEAGGAPADEDVPSALSDLPGIAVHQLLAQIGHPTTLDAQGNSIADDPADILADASPEQIRELALLGKFGHPGTYDGVDYSLFEQFYKQGGDGNWSLKSDTDDTLTSENYWATYLASKS